MKASGGKGRVATREGSGVRLQSGAHVPSPVGFGCYSESSGFSSTRVGPQVGNFTLEFQETLPVDLLSTPRESPLWHHPLRRPLSRIKTRRLAHVLNKTTSACVHIFCER